MFVFPDLIFIVELYATRSETGVCLNDRKIWKETATKRKEEEYFMGFVFDVDNSPKYSESESSDSYSDGNEEDQKDYCVGGYHPVEVVFTERDERGRLEKSIVTDTRFSVRWVGDSILRCGWFVTLYLGNTTL